MAGVTTAALVVPQSMAYATLAGLPVQAGLYTALAALPIYALLGTSRRLSVSVTSTVSILAGSALATLGPDRAANGAALLAIVFGVTLALAGLLRLGFMAQFISLPVLVGFKAGAGLYIASGQLGKIMGASVPSGDFFQQLAGAVARIPEAHGITILLGLVGIALLLAFRRWAPRVPAPLVVVALGIAAVDALGLRAQGVAVVGSIPPGLPMPALPDASDARVLVTAALGMALMSTIESIGAGRASAAREEPRIDANRELVALGAAAIGAGLMHGYPSSGGLSQTAVNKAAGARTQVSSLVTAGMVVLTLTLLTPLFEALPQAALGAIVLVAVAGLVDVASLRRIGAIRRRDLALSLVALVGVLLVGILDGVLVAVAVSLLVLVYQANHPPVELLAREARTGLWRAATRAERGETIPGLAVIRTEGTLYFANAQRVGDHVLALIDPLTPPPRVVVFDASVIPDMEVTGLAMLADLNQQLHTRGMQLWLGGLRQAPREMVHRALAQYPGPAVQVFDDVEAAALAFQREPQVGV